MTTDPLTPRVDSVFCEIARMGRSRSAVRRQYRKPFWRLDRAARTADQQDVENAGVFAEQGPW